MSNMDVVLGVVTALCLYSLLKAYRAFAKTLNSALRDLPGPRNASFLWGNVKEIQHAESRNVVLQEKWVEDYGHVMKYKGPLFVSSAFSKLVIRGISQSRRTVSSRRTREP